VPGLPKRSRQMVAHTWSSSNTAGNENANRTASSQTETEGK
jgi:hypothetical protein